MSSDDGQQHQWRVVHDTLGTRLKELYAQHRRLRERVANSCITFGIHV